MKKRRKRRSNKRKRKGRRKKRRRRRSSRNRSRSRSRTSLILESAQDSKIYLRAAHKPITVTLQLKLLTRRSTLTKQSNDGDLVWFHPHPRYRKNWEVAAGRHYLQGMSSHWKVERKEGKESNTTRILFSLFFFFHVFFSWWCNKIPLTDKTLTCQMVFFFFLHQPFSRPGCHKQNKVL